MKKILCVDASNLLYRTFYAYKNEDDTTLAGMAHHLALTTLNKYFKAFKPHQIVLCFDRSNWRKEYTKSEKCISKKIYKNNRRKDMTPKQKQKYQQFLTHLNEFESLMKEHSTSVVLAANKLEADDLIAGVVEYCNLDPNEQNQIIIISSDQDLLQLLKHPNVQLINPSNGKERTLEDWDGDANLFLFEKCIRGDRSDNVQSAFPNCRKTKIRKAYEDPLAKTNLMHEKWVNENGHEFVVKDLFKENELLMNLQKQPDDIQKVMFKTIMDGFNNPGTFSYFHFIKFCGKYELKKIIEQAENFTRMLSC